MLIHSTAYAGVKLPMGGQLVALAVLHIVPRLVTAPLPWAPSSTGRCWGGEIVPSVPAPRARLSQRPACPSRSALHSQVCLSTNSLGL